MIVASAQPPQQVFLSRAFHFFTGQREPMLTALASWFTCTLKEQLQ